MQINPCKKGGRRREGGGEVTKIVRKKPLRATGDGVEVAMGA